MATIAQNQDGTLTVTLSSQEQITASRLESGKFAAMLTQWLFDQSKIVFQEMFASLPLNSQVAVMAYFTAPSQPEQPSNNSPAPSDPTPTPVSPSA